MFLNLAASLLPSNLTSSLTIYSNVAPGTQSLSCIRIQSYQVHVTSYQYPTSVNLPLRAQCQPVYSRGDCQMLQHNMQNISTRLL